MKLSLAILKYLLLACLVVAAAACPPHCLDCDPDATICYACDESYQLTVLGSCVPDSTIPKCILYGPPPALPCFACQQTFSLSANKCVKDYSACVEADPADDTACLTCGFGTVLKGGKCTGTINCQDASAPCKKCADGFALAGSNCVDKTPGCQTAGPNGVCATCKDGYKLVGYQCVQKAVAVYGCHVYDAAGVCYVCKSGFNLFKNQCLFPAQISEVLQEVITLDAILAKRKGVSVTSVTPVTPLAPTPPPPPTPPAPAPPSGDSGFGGSDFGGGFGDTSSFGGDSSAFGGDSSGFGGDSHSFGGDGGFNSGQDTSGFSTPASPPPPPPLPPVENCKTLDPARPGRCSACEDRFYPSDSGCSAVSVYCQAYNIQTGDCLTCKFNLQLSAGKCNDANCQPIGPAPCSCATNFALNADKYCEFKDPNCVNASPTRCIECSKGFFVTTTGSCRKLPNNCQNANPLTFNCIQCVPAYRASPQGDCTPIPPAPNCATVDPINPANCRACNPNFNLANSQCVPAPPPPPPQPQPQPPQSQSKPPPGYPGYDPAGGQLIIAPTITIQTQVTGQSTAARDPNCAKYNGTSCSACSNRYYVNPSNICVPVNPLCKDYLPTGNCLTCYPGYTLSSAGCAVSKQTDPFCRSFTPGGICTQCYTGYYYSQPKAACQPQNTLCKTFIADGSCTSCFPGYSLSNGNCIVSFQDPNCQKPDATKGCQQCANKFFLDSASNRCKQISSLCKTGDQSNGNCLSCFSGYVLQRGSCVVGGASTMDVNCQNNDNGVCKKCYSQYFLNPVGKCVQVNPLCKTSDQNTGGCLTCYPGYTVSGPTCAINSSPTLSSDVYCKAADANGVCTGCYSGYRLNSAKCLRIDPLCKTYVAAAAACDSCYEGYTLSNGSCVVTAQQVLLNDDPFCIKSQGTACLTCANGYYLAPSGVCSQLNALCKSSDMSTGYCTECYTGYVLSGTTCVVAPPVNIAFCAVVANGVCASCMSGYYVAKGACELANTLCATFEPVGGACLSCIPGYVYQAGQCIYPSLGIDSNCVEYSNSFCCKCASGYALVNYWCEPIDSDCVDYDFIRNLCNQCKSGKQPQGAACA